MRTVKWTALFCTALLIPATGSADDALDQLYESRWRLSHPVDSPTYTSNRPVPSSPLKLDMDADDSLLSVIKIRSLSLYTLSGDERSKWFLGVNEDGLVGIHFRGFTQNGAKRHLDVSELFSASDDEASDDEASDDTY